MNEQEQDVIEAARGVAAVWERRCGLEPGALLGIAWMGASAKARRWERGAGASLRTWSRIGADAAVREALRGGELDGVRRSPRLRGARPHVRLGREPAGRPVTDRLAVVEEAQRALVRIARASAPIKAAVLWWLEAEGQTCVEVARRLGVHPSRVSQVRREAHEVA